MASLLYHQFVLILVLFNQYTVNILEVNFKATNASFALARLSRVHMEIFGVEFTTVSQELGSNHFTCLENLHISLRRSFILLSISSNNTRIYYNKLIYYLIGPINHGVESITIALNLLDHWQKQFCLSSNFVVNLGEFLMESAKKLIMC